jgi:drug/metabolite transporter (DMT)-like permease
MALVPVLVSSVAANEVTIGITRVFIACAVLTPVLLWHKNFKGLATKDWLAMLAIGMVFGLHWWTYFYAIKNSTPSLGALSLTTYGIHLVWINWVISAQAPKLSDVLAILLCFCGCIIVVPSADMANHVTQAFLVGVFSGFLYALLPFLHQKVNHLSTTVRSWGQFSFAGVFFLFFWPQTDWQLNIYDWQLLLILGVVSTLIAHTLWVKVSTELPSILVSAFYYLYIPIAMVMSYIFMDEAMTTNKLLGATLIVTSCLIGIIFPALRNAKKSPS